MTLLLNTQAINTQAINTQSAHNAKQENLSPFSEDLPKRRNVLIKIRPQITSCTHKFVNCGLNTYFVSQMSPGGIRILPYISDENIGHFTPLHLFDRYSHRVNMYYTQR